MPVIVAFKNTPNESLELTRWVDTGDPEAKQKMHEMMALVDRLYLKLARTQATGKDAMVAAGTTEVTRAQDYAIKHRNTIHYALYEGRCLDPKRLSYFLPDRTIEEGNLTEKEVRRILAS
ncbi:MAG: hypothetical protein ABSF82_03410 [Candidatus Bathyarchaeia archaeon]